MSKAELDAAIDAASALLRPDAQPDHDTLIAHARAILEAARPQTPTGVLNDAVARTASLARHWHPQIAGIFAMTTGALVEAGADATPLASVVFDRLPGLLAAARRMLDLAERIGVELDDRVDLSPDDLVIGDYVLTVEALGAESPDLEALQSWDALTHWEPASLAVLLSDAELRSRARGMPAVTEDLAALDRTGAGRCLRLAIEMLDDEPLVVVDVPNHRGWRFRIGGISDNFQLHMLLAGDILGGDTPARGFLRRLRASPHSMSGPPPDVLSVWAGTGPQLRPDRESSGVWNLYQWRALRPDRRLPDAMDHEHWIWNEGVPADIETFEGTRTVLLGPPSYQRSFNTARFFDRPKPSLVRDADLDAAAVDELLDRMAGTS